TQDNLNLNVCHFGSFAVSAGAQVARGQNLGNRSTSWIHLSLDDRNRNTAKPPVPFNGSHGIEGRNFDPQADTVRNQYNGATVSSTNGAQSAPAAPAAPSNVSVTNPTNNSLQVNFKDNAT